MQRNGFRAPPKASSQHLSEQKLQNAFAHHRAGKLREAKALYNDVLKSNPRHFDALRHIGMIEFQGGNFDTAADVFSKALKINPQNHAIHQDYGLTLEQLHRFDEAIAAYDRAIELKPDYGLAYSNRGLALAKIDRLDEAVGSYTKAISIDPDYAKAHINKGAALVRLHRFEQAVESLETSIKLSPNFAEAYYNLGICHRGLRAPERAISNFGLAIAINPDHFDALYQRGLVLEQLDRFDEALRDFDKAIVLHSRACEAFYHRAVVLDRLSRFDEAIAGFNDVISIKSDHYVAFENRGVVLGKTLKFTEAIADFDQAILLKPDYHEAFYNKGLVFKALEKWPDAIESFEKATEIKPDYADAYYDKSWVLLLTGQFEEGWKLQEWRKLKKQPTGYRVFDKPLWLGQESLQGKTILIHWEQGVGDTLQFCRFIQLLEAKGARTIFATQAKLANLMQGIGASAIIPMASSEDEIEVDFDFHCPLMSLPLAFAADLTNLPSHTPYLKADADLARSLRQRLMQGGGKKICGVSWSSKNRETGASRSVGLVDLFSAIDPSGYVFVNLQYGDVAEEIADLADKTGIDLVTIGEIDNYEDLDGFAALVDACDVILSIDNTTVHMAGALNKKTFVMLPYAPDWRWMLGREDSPWYPSMRLFRQARRDDWADVFHGVRGALNAAHQLDAPAEGF